MTDVDRLLNEDGTRWRAAQPTAPEFDPALFARPRRFRWQPLAAAAAVVIIAAGVVGAVTLRRSPDAPPPAAGPADEIVRDGDRVAGQGTVIAAQGQPVRMCVSGPQVSLPEPPPPDCVVGVPITGIDLGRLSSRDERAGTVWGGAWVEAVYRAGSLTVTRQEPYRQPPPSDPTAADPVPCPEPPGGWTRPPADNQAAEARLKKALARQPDVYAELQVRYPYGWHLQDESDRKGTVVYLVGTTGDVAAARRELTRVFPAEHLCVTSVEWSSAAMRAAQRAFNTKEAAAAGVGWARLDVINDGVGVDLVVLDERAAHFIAGVAGGRVEPLPLLEKTG